MNELNRVPQVGSQASQSAQQVEKKTWEYYIIGDPVRYLQRELNAQLNAGLSIDGYLGDKTLEALKSIIIKKGARGNITRVIQERLLQLGYSLPRFGADSDFGGETESAVLKFQKDRGLTQDAIVGINTFKELLRK